MVETCSLAEIHVVEGVVDRAQGETEPHRRIAIDCEIGLQAAKLLVGIDVLDDIVPHQRLGKLGARRRRAPRDRRKAGCIDSWRC